jgi:hypothetical protein
MKFKIILQQAEDQDVLPVQEILTEISIARCLGSGFVPNHPQGEYKANMPQ